MIRWRRRLLLCLLFFLPLRRKEGGRKHLLLLLLSMEWENGRPFFGLWDEGSRSRREEVEREREERDGSHSKLSGIVVRSSLFSASSLSFPRAAFANVPPEQEFEYTSRPIIVSVIAILYLAKQNQRRIPHRSLFSFPLLLLLCFAGCRLRLRNSRSFPPSLPPFPCDIICLFPGKWRRFFSFPFFLLFLSRLGSFARRRRRRRRWLLAVPFSLLAPESNA